MGGSARCRIKHSNITLNTTLNTLKTIQDINVSKAIFGGHLWGDTGRLFVPETRPDDIDRLYRMAAEVPKGIPR